jgi:hypothetical protein
MFFHTNPTYKPKTMSPKTPLMISANQSDFDILSQSAVVWWNWDQRQYYNPENTDWEQVWRDVQADPFPPLGINMECILYTYEQLTKHLPLETVFKHYFDEHYYFRYCPETLSVRIANQ